MQPSFETPWEWMDFNMQRLHSLVHQQATSAHLTIIRAEPARAFLAQVSRASLVKGRRAKQAKTCLPSSVVCDEGDFVLGAAAMLARPFAAQVSVINLDTPVEDAEASRSAMTCISFCFISQKHLHMRRHPSPEVQVQMARMHHELRRPVYGSLQHRLQPPVFGRMAKWRNPAQLTLQSGRGLRG